MKNESKFSQRIWEVLAKIHFTFWILEILGVGTIILTAVQEIRQHLTLLVVIIVDLIALLLIILGVGMSSIKHSNSKSTHKLVRVIKNPGSKPIYLLIGNVCSHIPDMATFNYFGDSFDFSLSDIEEITFEEMNRRFTIKGDLPSIKLHLPKPPA